MGDFKKYTSCELISRGKNVARKYLAKQILKNKTTSGYRGGGRGTAIYGLYQETMRFSYLIVCAAVKGMVFKQFTLG